MVVYTWIVVEHFMHISRLLMNTWCIYPRLLLKTWQRWQSGSLVTTSSDNGNKSRFYTKRAW